MDDKQQILDNLKDEFKHWEALLSGLSEEQITARQLPSDLSIKDVLAHLWAWQQRSIARMEAAVNNTQPTYPQWPEGLNPGSEEDVDAINAWIHETNLNKPWSSVYRDWREGFLRFIGLTEALSESHLFEAGRYPWLGKHSLSEVAEGTYEHHQEEHYKPLVIWLNQEQGKDWSFRR